MIQVITVEREYGSRGAEYAHHLAHRLGWKLIDSCLVEDVAGKAGVTPTLVKRCDERVDPWFYRFGKAIWLGGIERLPGDPDVFDSARMVELVRAYVQEQATKGSCVVVGRGAACMLAKSQGAFHVFVYASLARKIRYVEEHFPEHARDAESQIRGHRSAARGVYPAIPSARVGRSPPLPPDAELVHGPGCDGRVHGGSRGITCGRCSR